MAAQAAGLCVPDLSLVSGVSAAITLSRHMCCHVLMQALLYIMSPLFPLGALTLSYSTTVLWPAIYIPTIRIATAGHGLSWKTYTLLLIMT